MKKTVIYFIIEDAARKKWRNLRDQFKKERKKVVKPKSGAEQGSMEKYRGKWSHYVSMLFLKDMETPRNTWGTFSEDEEEVEGEGEEDDDEEDEKSDEEEEADSINKDEEVLDESLDTGYTMNMSSGQISEMEKPEHSQKPKNFQKETQPTIQVESRVQMHTSNKNKKRKQNDLNFEHELLQLENKKVETLINSIKKEKKDDEDMHFLQSIHPYFARMLPLQKLKVRTQIQEILMKELSMPSTQNLDNTHTHFTYPYQGYSMQPLEPIEPIEPLTQSSPSVQKPNYNQY